MGELVRREVERLSGELTPRSMQLVAPTVLHRLLDSAEWRGLLDRTLPEVAASSGQAAVLLREERPHGQGDAGSSLASTWNQAYIYLETIKTYALVPMKF
jgi:hypothetical protein